jgi:hypothetical protein
VFEHNEKYFEVLEYDNSQDKYVDDREYGEILFDQYSIKININLKTKPSIKQINTTTRREKRQKH